MATKYFGEAKYVPAKAISQSNASIMFRCVLCAISVLLSTLTSAAPVTWYVRSTSIPISGSFVFDADVINSYGTGTTISSTLSGDGYCFPIAGSVTPVASSDVLNFPTGLYPKLAQLVLTTGGVIKDAGMSYPLVPASGGNSGSYICVNDQGGVCSTIVPITGTISTNPSGVSPGSCGTTLVVGTLPTALSSTPSPLVTTPTYIGVNGALNPVHATVVDGYEELYVGCQSGGSSSFISGCTINVKVCEATTCGAAPTDSGGHQHDDGMRPLGEIVIADGNDALCTPCASQIKNLSAGGTLPTEQVGSANSSVTFTTKSSTSPIKLAYLPPQVGGNVNLSISATDTSLDTLPTIQQQVHVTSAVGTRCTDGAGLVSLCPLFGPGYFDFTGATGPHPDNHYGTYKLLADLNSMATYWFTKIQAKSTTPIPLAINDTSLLDGGVFDLDEDWNQRHKAHRWGDMADIGSGSGKGINYWLPVKVRSTFRAYLVGRHYKVIDESNHWHIQPSTP